LTDLEIRVNVGMQVLEDEKPVYKYFALTLERERVKHADELDSCAPYHQDSPFYGFTEEDMKNADVELYVMLRRL